MTASVQTPLRAPSLAAMPPVANPLPEPAASGVLQWPVDAGALARCRALLGGGAGALGREPVETPAELRLVDVPPAYASFCRSHFASVRRMRADLDWEDARPAYALALAAHAVLCDALDEDGEQVLARHWEQLRGGSRLDWARARPLLADGCRALGRLDPLAMHR